MKYLKKKGNNEIKIVWLAFILSFIGSYLWQTIIHTIVAVYESGKLGSREAGTAFMNKLFKTNLPLQLVAYIGMELVILLIIYAIIKI